MRTADFHRQGAAALMLAKCLLPGGCNCLIAHNALFGGRPLELVPIPDLAKLTHGLAADILECIRSYLRLEIGIQV